MHNEILNLIRVALLGILVLTGATLGVTSEPSSYREPKETTRLETLAEATPDPTEAPAEPSAPTETEPPTETTTQVTEATEATEPPTEPETEPTEPQPTYTEEELEMLALVIYQESGGDACSDDTRLMVGTVVMNRIADERFPNTMHGVITQEAQYGRLHWTGIVWPDRASHPSEAHAVKRAYALAERILLGERVLPEDVIWQAEFPQGSEVVAFQDGMYFCR